jgi:ABC-type transport system substrate-binding protein
VFHSRGIEGRYNDISFSDPEIDRLIDLAKSTRDRAERRKIWWKFQERFHEVHPITVLYASDAIYPVRKDKVENPVMDVRGALYRVHEWRPAGRGT